MQKHTSTTGQSTDILEEVDEVLATNQSTAGTNDVEEIDEEQARADELHQLAVKAADAETQSKEYAAQAKEAKARLYELLELGSHQIGNLTVTVTKPPARFNAAAFEANYPAEVNPHMYKQVLDTSAIPPKLKKDFSEVGAASGTVKIK
ncbi:hypothetical protein [Zhihengliuella flava]|uniref:Uncharacterized protein n=1 Tax=Zhihengliuella flava TaxID=1285193 RepID=A0A931D3W3_9MICC|nr:hypothetical protein [Zhihengliuella flava]MBG6083275.1 hypothetical protein [Zhihengliuella flava]